MARHMIPIGPLQLWVWRKGRQGVDRQLMAARMQCSSRVIERWMEAGRETILDSRADDLLSCYGERLETVYPASILDAPSRSRSVLAWIGMALDALPEAASERAARERRCRWGDGCFRPVGPDSDWFCAEHGGWLASIRAELRTEALGTRGAQTFSTTRVGRGGRAARARCCALDCDELRAAGSQFCDVCQDAGRSEEAA